ncbi:unnamed protein product [Vitrella brassicaformis CCMP3155]|uniref:ENTH domain-containing protein n=2 Tax=Vitrella brassicaformis TaxID=1169539 RepID=A0A0G4EZL0_VITBC|nr:unnamed protein product [Vitrella brassicaformis CCMP3155]|eukprot:CEM04567.1 unnamed protein product [Vitrella brassicaformis CCMP3155]
MDRALLNRATSQDDVPTPGYMFNEIAQMTFLHPEASEQLHEYLLKKLQRDNPYVKLKVLRIIKHVAEKGKPDFRRAVQRKAEVIKACLTYRGAPDPLKGDAPSKDVREEAEQTVKALFSAENAGQTTGLDASGRIQGFGSDLGDTPTYSNGPGAYNPPPALRYAHAEARYGGESSYRGPSSFSAGGGDSSGVGMPKVGGMTGFGNPAFDHAPQPSRTDKILSNISSVVSKVLPASSAVASRLPGGLPGTSRYSGPSSMGGYSAAGGVGGYQRQGGSSYQSPPAPLSTSGGMPPPPPPPTSAMGLSRPQTSAQPGEYEARLVEDLCAPGGAKIAPPAHALEDFCRKCESLDPAVVGTLLVNKAQDAATPWQSKLKVLYIMEALVTHTHAAEGEEAEEPQQDSVYTSYFQDNAAELLFSAQELPQCRQKATKVLFLLGLVDENPVSPAPARHPHTRPHRAAHTSPVADLIDMDSSQTPTQRNAAPTSAATDLLGSDDLLISPSGGALGPPSAVSATLISTDVGNGSMAGLDPFGSPMPIAVGPSSASPGGHPSSTSLLSPTPGALSHPSSFPFANSPPRDAPLIGNGSLAAEGASADLLGNGTSPEGGAKSSMGLFGSLMVKSEASPVLRATSDAALPNLFEGMSLGPSSPSHPPPPAPAASASAPSLPHSPQQSLPFAQQQQQQQGMDRQRRDSHLDILSGRPSVSAYPSGWGMGYAALFPGGRAPGAPERQQPASDSGAFAFVQHGGGGASGGERGAGGVARSLSKASSGTLEGALFKLSGADPGRGNMDAFGFVQEQMSRER